MQEYITLLFLSISVITSDGASHEGMLVPEFCCEINSVTDKENFVESEYAGGR